jgi:hypothetical protein
MFLVHPLSQTWKVEDISVLESNASDGSCQFNSGIYKGIAERNSAPANLSSKVAPHEYWRVATDREIAAIENTLLPSRLGDDFVFSVGSLSMPAYSDDRNTAYVLLSFSWGMHGGYGEYILIKDRSRWLVQCRDFHNYL